jgi:hypothetical protein
MTKPTTKTAVAAVKLNTDADFAKDVLSIAKRADTVQMDIHRHLYAIAFRWNETGDIRPAVSRVNLLIGAMPKGIRVNAIRTYVEAMFGFIFVEKATGVLEHFIAGPVKGAALPMDSILNKRWFEFSAEPPYTAINFGADLAKLLKRASDRMNSTKGDEVDKFLLDAVSKAVAERAAAKHAEEQAGKLVAEAPL